MMVVTVLVTGASGLLGRSVVSLLEAQKDVLVLKCAYSRATDGYIKLNLLDPASLEGVVQKHKPDVVVHCAAQRFPNKVEEEFEETQRLNIEASRKLAEESGKAGGYVIYIGTDYVFDGTNPPYAEDSEPNPINKYGETKLLGEKAVLDVSKNNIILRVPVLYGPVEYLDESAVTTLWKNVVKQEPQNVSDLEVRYPAHARDIAHIIHELIVKKTQNPEDVRGIYHWCGKEALTKFQMVKIIGGAFGKNTDHIHPCREESTSGPKRPKDAQLTTKRLDDLGISKHTPFQLGIKEVLERFVE